MWLVDALLVLLIVTAVAGLLAVVRDRARNERGVQVTRYRG